MSKRIYAGIVFICLFTGVSNDAITQLSAEHIQDFILTKNHPGKTGTVPGSSVNDFYNRMGYTAVWLGDGNKTNLDDLLELLQQSATAGLEEADYQPDLVMAYRQGRLQCNNLRDSLEAEVQFTLAALQFCRDLEYGNQTPVLGYEGLNYRPGCSDIPGLLAAHVSGHRLKLLLNRSDQGLPEITALEKKLRWLLTVMSASSFTEVIINSRAVSGSNKLLVTKLYQLGILGKDSPDVPDSLLKEKLREAQRQFNLPVDGLLRPAILEELNRPLSTRRRQLNLSINYYRWLGCLTRDQPVVVVNIPAAFLKVYENKQVILGMRIIVGKRSTRTPTLASRITEVILYPYWNVPNKIATKELLPSIQKNPGFINAGNFQVLNSAGKVVDPYSIDWQQYSRNNFPFRIRQSTGCDNSLGLLKLDFYNPFGVYLHDTPGKTLFLQNRRFFSHGCMRMEKPLELGHLVLAGNEIAIDTLTEKGCLRNQSPITVPAVKKIPVIVWYNPAGLDASGIIVFYEDVYRKLSGLKNAGKELK